MEFKMEKLPIRALVKADYNPRRLTDRQFKDLRRSMSEFGPVQPAVVNTYPGRENVIVGGHARIRVAESLGMTEYLCVLVHLPLPKERELNIRLNKNTGEFDMDALANAFESLDLLDWGFSETELGLDVSLGDGAEKEKKARAPKVCPHCGESLAKESV